MFANVFVANAFKSPEEYKLIQVAGQRIHAHLGDTSFIRRVGSKVEMGNSGIDMFWLTNSQGGRLLAVILVLDLSCFLGSIRSTNLKKNYI